MNEIKDLYGYFEPENDDAFSTPKTPPRDRRRNRPPPWRPNGERNCHRLSAAILPPLPPGRSAVALDRGFRSRPAPPFSLLHRKIRISRAWTAQPRPPSSRAITLDLRPQSAIVACTSSAKTPSSNSPKTHPYVNQLVRSGTQTPVKRPLTESATSSQLRSAWTLKKSQPTLRPNPSRSPPATLWSSPAMASTGLVAAPEIAKRGLPPHPL